MTVETDEQPAIDLKKEKMRESTGQEANAVKVSQPVAPESDLTEERADADKEVTHTKEKHTVWMGNSYNDHNTSENGNVLEREKHLAKDWHAGNVTGAFCVNDPGHETRNERDILFGCEEDIFLAREEPLLQKTRPLLKKLQIEIPLADDIHLNLTGDAVLNEKNLHSEESQSENRGEEQKKPPAQEQVEDNCLEDLENLEVYLTAAKKSIATKETHSEIIRDENESKEQNCPQTENYNQKTNKHLEHLSAKLLNRELKQLGTDELNMTDDNKPLTEEFGNGEKHHGQINGEEGTQDESSFARKPEPQALDSKSTEREKENADETVAEKKIAQNEAPVSKDKQEKKNKKRRKRAAKASQVKRQGTEVKNESSPRQPSRGIDVKIDSKVTKPEANIPRKLAQQLPDEQEQDNYAEGAGIPRTLATHAGIPEDATGIDLLTDLKEETSKPWGSKPQGKSLRSSCRQRKALVRFCTWAACAVIFPCLLCCLAVDAKPLQQESVTSCKTDRAVFDGSPSIITCNFTHDLRNLRLPFHVLKYDFESLDPVADAILTCLWDEGDDDPRCIAKIGYVLDKSMTNTAITIRVSNTKKENAGRYVCEDSLSRLKDRQGCDLDVKGWDISCAPASPQAVVGTSTNVTCRYNSNLRITREDFYIYKFAGDGSDPVKVADCKYKNDTVDKPDCTVESGYELDKDFGTNVTLLIKSVEKIHAGKYTCNVLPYIKEVKVHSCALDVQEASIKQATPASQIAATQHGTLAPTVSSRMSCGSKIQVVKGKTALITCMIPEDIDSQTANISVEKVVNKAQPLASAEYTEQVLSCHGNSSCEAKDGYHLIGKPVPTIQLQIPNVTEEHDGMYVCTFKANLYSETQMGCLQTVLEDTSGASRLHPPMSGTKIAEHLATVIFLPVLPSLLILF